MIRVELVLKILTYAAVGISFSSVAPYMGWIYLAAFLLLAALALVADFRNVTVLPRFVLNILATIAVTLSLFRIDETNIILPGLEALSILMPLKLLERMEPRDYLQIYFLTILLLAGSSLLSLDMVFLAYLAVCILLFCAAAILVSCLAERASLRLSFSAVADMGKQSFLMALIVIPVAGLLFFVLPRTNYPLFDFLNRNAVAKSGFSDSVRLGNVSQIQMDESVVMRVGMERIDGRFLYWRGIVFDHFDGQVWRVKDRRGGWRPRYKRGGRSLRYTVYLEPSEFNTILTLDHPAFVLLRQLKSFDDYTFTSLSPLTRKISYEAISVPWGVIDGETDDLSRYLTAPSGMTDVKTLAAEIAMGRQGMAAAEGILGYLRSGRYAYALKGLPASQRPLEDFLFAHRVGNCEYFASAMAMMLRFQGIPARLVGGYRGGYYHEFGRYYVVPQRFAHVWVEAFFPGRGWVRFDPTPTAADASPAGPGMMFRIRMVFDILEYYWNITIINYDLQKQIKLFDKIPALLRPVSVKLDKAGVVAVATAVAGLLLLGLISFYTFRFAKKSRERRILEAFSRRMAQLGYRKKSHEGLEEFIKALAEGHEKTAALDFVEKFQGLYYRDVPLSRQDEDDLRRMIKLI